VEPNLESPVAPNDEPAAAPAADAAGTAPPPPPSPGDGDQAWTFRGFQMKSSDFNAAMVHFFRAEISRANTWRQRLDATTNWAVLTTGAAISIAFRSETAAEHGVIILSTMLVTLFGYIEARRYRYYEIWSYRVRLMETDYFAAMLVPPFRPRADWAEALAENLLVPRFPITMWEAWGRRFRRNYLWIYVLLGLAWVIKIWIHPTPAPDLSTFVDRAAIGSIQGEIVLAVGLLFNGILMAVGIATVSLMRASGEVLPRYGSFQSVDNLGAVGKRADGHRGALFRPSRRRGQVLAFVITDNPEAVASAVTEAMHRGVTAVAGKGMYTGQARWVLMSALTVTEVTHFESLVEAADPHAFVIVTPAREVMGSGFVPLADVHGKEPLR
jgi:uncharacterized membrane protein